MIGTVKRNKTFLPVDFQAKKALPLGESKFLFRHETTLVSFQSKRPKNVILLSTTHQKPEICPETTKPDIMLDYNKTKGGVDAMDQMAYAFTTKRKTKRWPLVVFFNILDLSSIAARVIFQLKYPVDKLSHEDCRQRFNADVGRSMAYAHMVRRSTVPTLQKEALNLLRVVGHTDWGAVRATLLKLDRTLVRSKLDYGSVIYGSVKKHVLRALDPIHHQGLHIALEAFRTSPIN
ncbi:PiggyBac transposable element-derived protein 4 [Plakobranchus ocellatus]|uniref:PiggyBac transposable element-derived protein 4 n=1 Tax=Plakobranchus ocellatus TaxID=259542 RepID=A0AAV4B4I2_9GAST|nr:PiggyBac transposable element-derived protein 4 [Plakobranchus ocellatus]